MEADILTGRITNCLTDTGTCIEVEGRYERTGDSMPAMTKNLKDCIPEIEYYAKNSRLTESSRSVFEKSFPQSVLPLCTLKGMICVLSVKHIIPFRVYPAESIFQTHSRADTV